MRLVVPLTYPGGHYAPHASLLHTQEGTMRLMPPPSLPPWVYTGLYASFLPSWVYTGLYTSLLYLPGCILGYMPPYVP